MPLNFLRQPAFVEAATHFEANNFVTKFHEIVVHCNVTRLVHTVEQVALDGVLGVVPLLRLPCHLAALDGVVHHLAVLATPVVTVDLTVTHFGMETLRSLRPGGVLNVGGISAHQCALFQRVGNRQSADLAQGLVCHREQFVGDYQHGGLVDVCWELGALGDILVEVDPLTPKLFHLCPQLLHWFE